MSIINYSATHRLLTVARGHPYERDAFAELFSGLTEFDVNQVEQPLAQEILGPKAAQQYDAIVCYDMPGVDFTCEDAPRAVPPNSDFVERYLAMLSEGIGMVLMHHAIAAWPAWPEYAEIVGGRFHYREAPLRGKTWPDSGYRHSVTHNLSATNPHPVTEGLPEQFAMTDELYLCPIFENDIEPLLLSDANFTDSDFYSAHQAVAGNLFSRENWSHPDGSNVVAWVKRAGNSPLVYLQGGDDAAALGNKYFQRLVHNAVRWVSSEAAHQWVRAER